MSAVVEFGLLLMMPLANEPPDPGMLAVQSCKEGRPVYVIRIDNVREKRKQIGSSVFDEQTADVSIIKTIGRLNAKVSPLRTVASQTYVSGPPVGMYPLKSGAIWLLATPPNERIVGHRVNMVQWRHWTMEKAARDSQAEGGYFDSNFDALVARIEKAFRARVKS